MSDFAAIRFQPQRPLLQEISADRLNTILQEIRRNKPKGERGITVRQSGDGTYIGLAATLTADQAPAQDRRPWDIYITETDQSNFKVKVRPGTIANLLPNNWDSIFTVNKTQLHYGKVRVTTDGFSITGATIEIDTDKPVNPTPLAYAVPSATDYLFGLFIAGANFRIATGAISFPPRVYMVKEKSTPAAPGESPYEIFYQLRQF